MSTCMQVESRGVIEELRRRGGGPGHASKAFLASSKFSSSNAACPFRSSALELRGSSCAATVASARASANA